jgi:hypothetical protein
VLEALELYAIGSALHETRGDGASVGHDHDPEKSPHLARALRERALSPDEIFDKVCEKIIETVVMTTIERGGSAAASSTSDSAESARGTRASA